MDEEIQSPGTAEEVGHAVVDVKGLVNSMKENLGSISKFPPPFPICRVPATIRKDNHVYYNPKIVSIGPFHRPRRNLRAMEEHKWRYLQNFLREMEKHKRGHLHNVLDHCTSEPALEECVKKLKEIVEKARKCYSGNINKGLKPNDEFVKMMLLDGSFIIQLLLPPKETEEDDPIRRQIWMLPAIAGDMLLLENQLPLCVLECLAGCIGRDANVLKEAALRFFSESLPDTLNFKQSAENYRTPEHEIHHLLHLVHWSLKLAPTPEKPFCAQPLQVVREILSVPRRLANNEHEYEHLPGVQEAEASSITVQIPEAEEQVTTIPTATELKEAGVVFERNEKASFLDVGFKKGVMQLTRLRITDNTNSLFRNIIAFEQSFPDSGVDFTSYCMFMDSLVNTPRDVQILKQSHIIENNLGCDEDVALLFNQLCKEIVGSVDAGSVREVCKAVNQYAATPWHKWRARLKHDYFSNPWAVISLIAAVYVIFLTTVSTYYAAF